MTKKSAARLFRDEQRKAAEKELKGMQDNKTPIWDEITGLYNNFVRVLNSNVEFVTIMRENSHLQPFYVEPGVVANYINILGRDHNELAARLEKIREAHKDKFGNASQHNDIILAMSLGNEYALFGQQVEAIINPTIAHLRTFTAEAEKAYNESQARKDAEMTDVTVVSDVPFKEETTAE